MKRFEKIFKGKISYKRIDKYVDLVRKTLDADDEMQVSTDAATPVSSDTEEEKVPEHEIITFGSSIFSIWIPIYIRLLAFYKEIFHQIGFCYAKYLLQFL